MTLNYKIYKLFFVVALLFSLVSCEEFEEFNENPNEPTEVTPDVLFTSGIRQSVNTAVNESFLLGNNVAQLTAKTLRLEVDIYNWNAFPTVWEGMYGSLTDIVGVEEMAAESGNQQLEGAAIVLRSWVFATLTNAYGDIPYFDAIKADDNILTPAYDPQETIYNDILNELDRANALLGGSGSISGDILYEGDAAGWQKFCNSLRLRLLMTAGDKISDVKGKFSSIVNNASIMAGNEDNATLTYLGSFPNQFPLVPLKAGDFDAVAFSLTSYSEMLKNRDPRLARYARPKIDTVEIDTLAIEDPSVFYGSVNGGGGPADTIAGSQLGWQYYNSGLREASDLGLPMAEGIIMTYAEVEFLLAEAVEKGWINGTAEDHYRNGIQASMDYHLVDYGSFGWTGFDDFYNNSGVAFSETKDIWRQKWLALYFHGLEPYFEVRRWYFESGFDWAGIPFLSPPSQNVNNDMLPLRFLYPGEEQSLNFESYQDAVNRLTGGNTANGRMWLMQ